ncbi:SAVED domain-containing protein [Paenibacillus sp. S150]|uniref:SAVED domain-containing protein n=1 Tax=Paenibacillus sp. S150 TaxID=2749826 RepID=UPI001C57A7D1|nr:SAVED domain-containing protein [Paenibacillus sp. S150]MBW4079992.1 SAVED domain-containing protein [Paenibacillus sp. S150]
MENEEKPRKRRQLSRAETFHLWMVCGGICSFDGCNERLVVNTKGKLTNIGIVAHIIGHSDGGPRHEFAKQYGYSDETLEDISNLMLMCYTHSKLIDDKHTLEHFSPNVLFEMKLNHELWVRSWTEQKRTSLAIVHKRLGPPMVSIPQVEQSSNILLEAIENQTEFNQFDSEGWEKGKEDNEKLYQQFKDRIQKRKYDVAEVFALSPIPLLIHLGLLLSDTVPLTIYQYDRVSEYWVNRLPDNQELDPLNTSHNININNCDELVVTVSISDNISKDDVQKILKDFDLLDISIDNPHVKRVLFKDQVQEIQRVFKDKIEELLRKKRYSKLHLFYAGPAGLAIELGRSINPRMWPKVVLYQFNYRGEFRYSEAITI